MKEYGGYIELDTYRLPMLHEGSIALNCGRNCLAYLIIAKRIKNEEEVLEKDLKGYIEYKEKVKYRLIPYIW